MLKVIKLPVRSAFGACRWMSGRQFRLLAAMLVVLPGYGQVKSDVFGSKHDLSVSGGSGESEVCIYCHTPHNSHVDPKPLWNHTLSTATYSTYTSSTFNSAAPAPAAGVSKLCLSCHDGTVALGQTVSRGLLPTGRTLGAGTTNLTTDLSNDHPLGFQASNDGQLSTTLFQNPPASKDPTVKLPNGRTECTSCHNPHKQNVDAVAQNFLVRTNSNGAICLACHDPWRPQPNWLNGWASSSHSTASNTVPAGSLSFGPYPSVSANACTNCHRGHNAAPNAKQRVLRGAEEEACRPCHAGTNLSPALLNVFSVFNKAYQHPVTAVAGVHDPAEDVAPLNSARHAECADCHNAHAASDTGGSLTPPGVQAPLLGASGYDGGSALRPAANEYQVCFKCHASSSNKPQAAGYANYGRTIVRTVNSYDERLRFSSGVAYHNVTQQRNTALAIPSLRSNMLTLSGGTGGRAMGTNIYCTDCHSNDENRKFGGTGPNGPHGSRYPHLLERRFDEEPLGGAGVGYSAGITGPYALCDKCHNISGSILANASFKKHDKHVRGERTSCTTCHDPHGIAGGTLTNNKWLINFDTAIVTPDSSGRLRFESTGTRSGRCYLTCHGEDHNPLSYSP